MCCMQKVGDDLPPLPDLPACRVSDDPHTGLDSARPLYVQESPDRKL